MEGIASRWGSGYPNAGHLVRDRGPTPRDVRGLVESASRPVRKLANTVAASRGADADDLYQTGMEYALRLAPSFRPELGATFVSFIYLRVRHAMRQACQREGRERGYATAAERGVLIARERVAVGYGRSETVIERQVLAADVIAAFHGEVASPEELVAVAEERARVRARVEAVLASLDWVDRELVRGCIWKELSLAEAARRVGLEYHLARHRYGAAMEVLERRLRHGY